MYQLGYNEPAGILVIKKTREWFEKLMVSNTKVMSKARNLNCFWIDQWASTRDDETNGGQYKNAQDADWSQSFNGHQLSCHQSRAFIYRSNFSIQTINGNFTTDIYHCVQMQQTRLDIHLMLEGKWGRILAEMKKGWLEGRARSIIHSSVAHISLIIHLTLAPDSREAKIDVCSSSQGLPYKQEYCFQPLIKPVGRWHVGLERDLDWAGTVSRGEKTDTGEERKMRMREGDWEMRGMTNRDQNESSFLSISFRPDEIWICWLITTEITQAQRKPHMATRPLNLKGDEDTPKQTQVIHTAKSRVKDLMRE